MSEANGTVKIDKGIKFVRKPTDGRRYSKYPWDKMKVGDSFLMDPKIKSNSGYTIAKLASLRTGMKFTARMTHEGFRCWREE
jgi:hypothetical protein